MDYYWSLIRLYCYSTIEAVAVDHMILSLLQLTKGLVS